MDVVFTMGPWVLNSVARVGKHLNIVRAALVIDEDGKMQMSALENLVAKESQGKWHIFYAIFSLLKSSQVNG